MLKRQSKDRSRRLRGALAAELTGTFGVSNPQWTNVASSRAIQTLGGQLDVNLQMLYTKSWHKLSPLYIGSPYDIDPNSLHRTH